MTWKKITLERNSGTDAHWGAIQNEFEDFFTLSGAPEDFALYTDRTVAGKDAQSFYFSPAAVKVMDRLLRDYNFEECSKPDGDSVTLLVGHDKARDPDTIE